MNATRWTVLSLLALAGITFLLLIGGPTPPAPASPDAARQSPQSPATPEPSPPAPATSTAAPSTAADHQRQQVERLVDDSQVDAGQGIRGRVLLPGGAPAAGIPVFLMPNTMHDPIDTYLKSKSGIRTPPLAFSATAADGTFALGVKKIDTPIDLRVVSDLHPELHHKGIKIRADDWYDAGTLQLEQGLIVVGRVVQEGTGQPIADAQVFLNEANATHQMLPTPGREQGITARTNAAGLFRFANAPRLGLIHLAAQAQSFCRVEKHNLQIAATTTNEFVLELAVGLPIAGVVTDNQGNPIRGCTILATALSAKAPQTGTASSDTDGRFRLEGLREGEFQLAFTAKGYEEHQQKPVPAGMLDLGVALEPRAFAKLKVLAANGAPIKAYKLALKRFFPDNPLGIGNVPEFRDLRITPGDYPPEFSGEWAVIRGVPIGDFVFQIEDNGQHAKSLSEPFQVVANGTSPEVVCRLTLGGVIEGHVVDDQGRPVSGAVVVTDHSSGMLLDPGNAFGQMLRQFMPEKHSTASARTDADGRFRLTRLAFADYLIRVRHPDFCGAQSQIVTIGSEGQRVDAGELRLRRGTIVTGTTTLDGQPMGQINVTLTTPPAPAGAAPPTEFFQANATSDGNGTYTFTQRVPPGTWTIHAVRRAGTENPFDILVQQKQTQRPLVIAEGTDRVVQDFALRSN
ncbi:MAG: carboxypeptidase regulatory-like domain-containing protein [Planctomycetes bacterium]|nr:carboxypeptidase regulatory-like domain-containing protein [Planctomycetota bacterium]